MARFERRSVIVGTKFVKFFGRRARRPLFCFERVQPFSLEEPLSRALPLLHLIPIPPVANILQQHLHSNQSTGASAPPKLQMGRLLSALRARARALAPAALAAAALRAPAPAALAAVAAVLAAAALLRRLGRKALVAVARAGARLLRDRRDARGASARRARRGRRLACANERSANARRANERRTNESRTNV